MATWNIKEETGKMYVYCSKNAVSDVAASNFFGKAAAWVSGGTYASNDRVTSSSIQYRNKTGVNTTTAPASDTNNWEFDLDNFQPYLTTKNYVVGSKTNYYNEHYVCITNTSGAFDVTKWNKVIISNRDVPYKLMNTAINLINSDARFVSSEVLDVVNNIAYHNINCILSNGIWNETLTTPTKYIRIIGQSNIKTQLTYTYTFGYTYVFFDTLKIPLVTNSQSTAPNFKFANTVIDVFAPIGWAGVAPCYLFFYKNIVRSVGTTLNVSSSEVKHVVSNTFIGDNPLNAGASVYKDGIVKNNLFKGALILNLVADINVGSIDYNCYGGTTTVNGTACTSLTAIKAAFANQNLYSLYNTGITLNSDYTLPVGSPLIKTGSNGNNIGAEGVGYPQTNSTIFDSANGAIYKNVTKYGTTLTRQQISKTAQGGGNNTITLEALASAVNNEYDGFRIYISSGTGSGQTKTILTYNASTKDATVDSNWTVNPDATSIYEILDGEITSAVGDLGSVQTVKKLLVQATNIYDATGYIINQNVSETDARLDNPSALTFDLRVANTSDLSAVAYRRFVQDDYLKVDNADKGCGDSAYSCSNVVSSVLTFRYFQIRLMLRK